MNEEKITEILTSEDVKAMRKAGWSLVSVKVKEEEIGFEWTKTSTETKFVVVNIQTGEKAEIPF